MEADRLAEARGEPPPAAEPRKQVDAGDAAPDEIERRVADELGTEPEAGARAAPSARPRPGDAASLFDTSKQAAPEPQPAPRTDKTAEQKREYARWWYENTVQFKASGPLFGETIITRGKEQLGFIRVPKESRASMLAAKVGHDPVEQVQVSITGKPPEFFNTFRDAVQWTRKQFPRKPPPSAAPPEGTGVQPDPQAISGFDSRALHEISRVLGARVRVASKREAAKMRLRGARGTAQQESLQVLLEPEAFNRMPLQQQRSLMAHELGHIVEYLGPDFEAKGPVGRILGLMGQVGTRMRGQMQAGPKKIVDQMLGVSFGWRPVSKEDAADAKYMAYRENPVEVWADFFSAVLVNPLWVRQKAPDAWRAFHEGMPDTLRADYLALRAQLSSDESKLERDVRWQQELHEKQAQEIEKRTAETALELRERRNSSIKELEVKFLARGGALRRATTAAERRGELDPEKNPFSLLAQGLDRSTLLGDTLWDIPRILNANGLTEAQFDDFLRNSQIVEGDAIFDQEAWKAAVAENTDETDAPDPRNFIRFVHRLNVAGFSPDESNRLLDAQRKELGAEKFRALEDAGEVAWTGLRRALGRIQQSGILADVPDYSTPEARLKAAQRGVNANEAGMLAMMAARHYVPRAVLDFGGAESVSGIPKERRGSDRDLDRMLAAAEEKIYRAHHAAYLNDSKNLLIDFLQKADPARGLAPVEVTAEWRGESQEGGKTVRGGWVMTGRSATEQAGKGVVSTWRDGKQTHYAVDPWLAAAFARGDASAALAWIRNPNLFTRTMFLSVKPAWHLANAIRDAQRAWRNNPRYSTFLPVGFSQLGADYVRYLPIALQAGRTSGRRRAAAAEGGWAAERFLAAERAGVLPEQYRADVIYGDYGARAFDKWKTADYLNAPISQKKEDVRLAAGAWNRAKRAGYWTFVAPMYVMEALPRIAAYERALAQGASVDAAGNLSLREKRRIRTKIGSPPFDAALRGTNPVFSALFQFSTSAVNGWTEDIASFMDPETRMSSAVKSAQLVGLVSLTLAIRAGMFGGEDEDDPLYPTVAGLREEPSWSLGGAIKVPMPWAFDHERNREVFFNFPVDHTLLPVTIGLARAWKEVEAGSTAGEHVGPVLVASELAYGLVSEFGRAFPSVSASIDAGADLAQTLRGRNPYDDFRERNWFSDREFERLSYGERVLKYGTNILPRQMGAPWLSEQLPKAVGRGDFLRAGVGRQERPMIDAFMRRFVTQGDYGLAETARMAGTRARIGARREELPPQSGPWAVDYVAANPNASPGAIKRAASGFARNVEPDSKKRSRVARGAAREAWFRLERNKPFAALQGVAWPSVDGGNEVIETRMRAIVRSRTISPERLRGAVRDLYRAGALGQTPARRDLLLNVIREQSREAA